MHLRRLQSFESPEIIKLSWLVWQTSIHNQGSGAKRKNKYERADKRGGLNKPISSPQLHETSM